MNDNLYKPLKTASLKEEFVLYMEELILKGALKPGEKLAPERDLAKKLGVSRPVIHEGIITLETRGLVTLRPRHGVVVNDYRLRGTLDLLLSLIKDKEHDLGPGLTGDLEHFRINMERDIVSLLCSKPPGDLPALKEMMKINRRMSNAEQAMELGDVTVEALEAFFSSAYCTKASRHSYKPIIKELYRYLYDNRVLDKDYSTLVLKEPKVHLGTKVPSTYTENEIKRMIKAINRSSAKGKRDYLVMLLAAEYGWRASDITSFRLDQIDWEKNRISMVQYKTGVPVEFPLLASVGNAIIDYIKHGRPAGGDDVIIVNHENTHKGQKLKSPTIHSIVSKAMSTANIANWKDKKHGPHSLRHSLATNMLKQNVAIPIISTILGHQSTETTKTYIKVDIPKLRQCSLPVPELKSSYFQIIKEATV